jgi:hypothetical protein
MCAADAGPLSFENVSFHVSFVPWSAAVNAPCAAGVLTACFGISCPAVSFADQPMPRGAAKDMAASASVAPTTTASAASFFTFPSSGFT